MKVSFFVGGIPKSFKVGGIARFMRGDKQHMVPQRGNNEWCSLVGMIGRQAAPAVPFAGPVAIRLVFWLPRPQSAKRAFAPIKRPDLDNMLHKLTDSFNGVYWLDDSQIVDLHAFKRFADETGRAGLDVTIEEINPTALSGHWIAWSPLGTVEAGR